eukprot:TRINITY_DN1503_c0_g1_i2.p1 TRINITY_DN1503_c0_g1~~TRINITY_DN1503_c0_g1_i2.p1  ORF type:complete len:661 (+),score=141.19 TRINITY_DN1503_c0_g1_i2:239-2221(+)
MSSASESHIFCCCLFAILFLFPQVSILRLFVCLQHAVATSIAIFCAFRQFQRDLFHVKHVFVLGALSGFSLQRQPGVSFDGVFAAGELLVRAVYCYFKYHSQQALLTQSADKYNELPTKASLWASSRLYSTRFLGAIYFAMVILSAFIVVLALFIPGVTYVDGFCPPSITFASITAVLVSCYLLAAVFAAVKLRIVQDALGFKTELKGAVLSMSLPLVGYIVLGMGLQGRAASFWQAACIAGGLLGPFVCTTVLQVISSFRGRHEAAVEAVLPHVVEVFSIPADGSPGESAASEQLQPQASVLICDVLPGGRLCKEFKPERGAHLTANNEGPQTIRKVILCSAGRAPDFYPAAAFRKEAFLALEFCVDNITFLEETDMFRQLQSSAEMQQTACAIVDKYVREKALCQVNLRSKTRTDLETACRLELWEQSMFDCARREIISLLTFDSFFRFSRRKPELAQQQCGTSDTHSPPDAVDPTPSPGGIDADADTDPDGLDAPRTPSPPAAQLFDSAFFRPSTPDRESRFPRSLTDPESSYARSLDTAEPFDTSVMHPSAVTQPLMQSRPLSRAATISGPHLGPRRQASPRRSSQPLLLAGAGGVVFDSVGASRLPAASPRRDPSGRAPSRSPSLRRTASGLASPRREADLDAGHSLLDHESADP